MERQRMSEADREKYLSMVQMKIRDPEVIALIEDAYVHGFSFFTRDLLAQHTDTLNIQAYKYDGYVAMITQHTWMFLSRYEELRNEIEKLDITPFMNEGNVRCEL